MSLEDQSRGTARQAPTPINGRAARPSIAEALGLEVTDRGNGIWHEDFLWVGSRIRQVYGNRVVVADDPPAYLVSFPNERVVSVSCPLDGDHARCVRVTARVFELQQVAVPGIFEFVMRENAELTLARLGVRDGWLTAEHDLALCGACIPALEASVSAVGLVANRLHAELARAFGLSAA